MRWWLAVTGWRCECECDWRLAFGHRPWSRSWLWTSWDLEVLAACWESNAARVSKVFTDLLGPFGYNGSLILNVSHQLCPFLMPYPPLGIFGMGSEVVLSKLSFWMFRGIEMLCLSSDGIDMNRHLLYSVMIIDDLIQHDSAIFSVKPLFAWPCLSMHGAGAARSASLTMFESGCPSFSECRAGKSCSTWKAPTAPSCHTCWSPVPQKSQKPPETQKSRNPETKVHLSWSFHIVSHCFYIIMWFWSLCWSWKLLSR